MNAVEIQEAVSALAAQPFDREGFSFVFLESFGNKATTINRLRSGTSNSSDVGAALQRNDIAAHEFDDGVLEHTCIGRRFGNNMERLDNSSNATPG